MVILTWWLNEDKTAHIIRIHVHIMVQIPVFLSLPFESHVNVLDVGELIQWPNMLLSRPRPLFASSKNKIEVLVVHTEPGGNETMVEGKKIK